MLAQLGTYARNLLVANASLYVFIIGIYGHNARIYRFDHAGAIASPTFNYALHPEVLGRFYWRLVHPIHITAAIDRGTRYVVGSDATLWPTTNEEHQAVNTVFASSYNLLDIAHMVEGSYSIQARLGDDPELRTFVTLGKALHISPGLFSRATRVWKVVPLLRENEIVEHAQFEIMALKDTWRARNMVPEVENYNHIFKDETHTVRGLATCRGNLDLGEEIPDGHRTTSMDVTNPTTDLQNRHHMRMILHPVGKKLDEFTSTHLLVEGLRDAIEGAQTEYRTTIRTEVRSGHRFAFERNVLHRDVSFGNVMLTDNGDFRGYLQDFDYSTFVGDCTGTEQAEEIDKQLKDITVRMSRRRLEFCI
jgi:hypothetical protein